LVLALGYRAYARGVLKEEVRKVEKPKMMKVSEIGADGAKSGWIVSWRNENDKKQDYQKVEIWDNGQVTAYIDCSKIEIADSDEDEE